MVELLCRLKLTLLRQGLRRNPWQLVGLILGGLYGAGVVAVGVAGLIALRFVDATLAGSVLVLLFATITLAWTLIPLLVFGTDQTLDVSRLALLPVRARTLQPGLFASAFLSVPAVLTVVVMIAAVITWTRSVPTTVAAILATAVSAATCILLSRVLTTVFAGLLNGRRTRDVATVVMVLAASSVGIGVMGLSRGLQSIDMDRLPELLGGVAGVVGWTPFGWAWSVPADVAAGQWGAAALRALLAVALVVGLWLAWRPFLDRALTSPISSGGGGKAPAGTWIERLYPATPAGAVAARCLRYWRRDPRYLSSAGGLLIVPVIIIVLPVLNPEVPALIGLTGPLLVGLTAGLTMSYDLSYDGSAVWLHAITGLSGAADRWGRTLAAMTVIGPVLVLSGIAAGVQTGRPDLAALATIGSFGLTAIGYGVASVTSARWQPPVPASNENPFASKGMSADAWLAWLVYSVASGVAMLPPLGLALAGVITGNEVWWWVGVVVALALGAVVLMIGTKRGGRMLDRRWPEVIAAAVRH